MDHSVNKRTFVGLSLPANIKEQLGGWMEENQLKLPFRKWTIPEDIHITLHFLGETTEEQLKHIKSILTEVCSKHRSFSLSLNGFGIFGQNHQPRIFWSGVGGDLEQLQNLQKSIVKELDLIGFPNENRPYRPHITLARKYESNTFNPSVLPSLPKIEAEWIINKGVLYESKLGQRQRYHQIEYFSFSNT
ncbi:2'-5' RNA ligase [Seinonella peptonophila]|uniref:RNA 2',3'-cyclic phosphodiesterase n=1 Tax=Seinonella peptonophila TaxID=112248 RepID=A0A1M4SJQ9_9BACL|nr:RNA 2',3'-cyclic phosphodiesterase [Seinonella peptonophila]SHE32419.1 2'-5' RNA ligase [Seinonella peptonophila]